MFIAFVGLKNAGIIVADESTYVKLGSVTASTALGFVSILICGALLARKVKGSLFIGIVVTTLIGIPLGVTDISDGWMPVSAPCSITPIFCQFDFEGFWNLKMVVVVFSLLFVNIFDSIGTILGLVSKIGIKEDKDGNLPGVKEAMTSDAIGTTVGALLGSSTVSTYVESASGVAEGGRTGLTSFTVGILFLLSVFFAPVFLLVRSVATCGALVMVGVLMVESLRKIDFGDISEALPAFVTMTGMMLCYSIADGIGLGMLCYVLIKILVGKLSDLNLTLYILAAFLLVDFLLG